MPQLTHVDEHGDARMVPVGSKPLTDRVAIAEGLVRISRTLATAIQEQTLKKGDVMTVARIAGIQAAKQTDSLIPLCHQIPLTHVDLRLTLDGDQVRIVGEARATWRTGVEMEALTAVTVAALTVIDMGKAIDQGASIEHVRLLEKHGGKRGSYKAPEDAR